MKEVGPPVKNKHKVPKKQWAKWDSHSRRVFNRMMYSLRPRIQHLIIHPDARVQLKQYWETIRWNAAWLAADAANKYKRVR